MHKLSLIELLEFMKDSISIIKKRFSCIESADNFLSDDEGIEKLDSIILRIQTIGEALKNINKHESGFLETVAPKKYWSEIIKLRDLISHHYIDIDADTIYMICDEKLDELEKYISKLINSIKD